VTAPDILRAIAADARPLAPVIADRILAVLTLDMPEPVELRADFWDRVRGLRK